MMGKKPPQVLIGIGVLILGLSVNCLAQDFERKQNDLRTLITIYNLVNGLYLSEDQMEFILDKARGLETLRENLEGMRASRASDLTEALLDLKEEVKKEDPEISKGLAKRIHQNTGFLRRLRREYVDALKQATGQVKSKLTGNQIYLIESFKPCLIPPKGSSRVGQISSHSGPTKWLEKIRNMPPKRYETKKHEIANRFIQRVSLRLPDLSSEELDEAHGRLLQTMDEVRALSDVDFAIQKEDIASEIQIALLKGRHRENRGNLDRRIARFLLNRQTIPVLEEKLSKPPREREQALNI